MAWSNSTHSQFNSWIVVVYIVILLELIMARLYMERYLLVLLSKRYISYV
jgi:hypothetical protein